MSRSRAWRIPAASSGSGSSPASAARTTRVSTSADVTGGPYVSANRARLGAQPTSSAAYTKGNGQPAMESFFTRSPDAIWPKAGRLHVYALPPNDAVATIAAPYQDFITARGLPNLALQPLQWLHLSVERLNTYLDELAPAHVTALSNALKQHLATVPAFDLQVGPALVATHTITLDAVPDQPWRDLRLAVRQAATEALGPDAVTPPTGNGRPHVTVSYSTGHLNIEPHLGALNHVRAGRATFPVTTAHLLAVHQHADVGTYSWQPIAAFQLATVNSAVVRPKA